MGSYLPSGTASAPEDEPSTNSMGGGRSLLKASKSLDGLYWSSGGCEGAKVAVEVGIRGEASILEGLKGGTGRRPLRRSAVSRREAVCRWVARCSAVNPCGRKARQACLMFGPCPTTKYNFTGMLLIQNLSSPYRAGIHTNPITVAHHAVGTWFQGSDSSAKEIISVPHA